MGSSHHHVAVAHPTTYNKDPMTTTTKVRYYRLEFVDAVQWLDEGIPLPGMTHFGEEMEERALGQIAKQIWVVNLGQFREPQQIFLNDWIVYHNDKRLEVLSDAMFRGGYYSAEQLRELPAFVKEKAMGT